MPTEQKLRVGVIFGGRSGEHEVSLMSARSVLAALSPDRYVVTEIAITHAGAWLAGENLLQAMVDGEYASLNPVALLPDPTLPGLYAIKSGQSGSLFELLGHAGCGLSRAARYFWRGRHDPGIVRDG